MMTTPSDVTLEEWHLLYAAAARVHALAPWRFMDETQIFAVREPNSGALGFVSVMGTLGEHRAIAVYQGPEGLYGLAELCDTPDAEQNAHRVLEIPQLQVSFENRGRLAKEDKAVIDALGTKFARGAFPMFRSYVPGHFPWRIDAAEGRLLRCALEQLIEVVQRVGDSGLKPGSLVEGPYLLRSRVEDGDGWEDGRITVPPPPQVQIPIELPPGLLEAARGAKRVVATVEVDCFLGPASIGTKHERPRCGYTLLLVERGSGLVLGVQIDVADPDLPHMWGRLAMHLLQSFAAHGILPTCIAVRSPLLVSILSPLARDLGIKLERTATLRALDTARRALEQHLGR